MTMDLDLAKIVDGYFLAGIEANVATSFSAYTADSNCSLGYGRIAVSNPSSDILAAARNIHHGLSLYSPLCAVCGRLFLHRDLPRLQSNLVLATANSCFAIDNLRLHLSANIATTII